MPTSPGDPAVHAPGAMGRTFAVIPAAGRSRRMGTHKLLLPVGRQTVIRRLLDALDGLVSRTFVLVREEDEDLRRELSQTSAAVITTRTRPPQMRDSVELLLDSVRVIARPEEGDAWLLIPADHPCLSRETLLLLLREQAAQPEAIHVPTRHGQRGHPTLFPWSLAAEVAALPGGQGVNELLKRPALTIREHEIADPSVLWDLDTPEDYERLRSRFSD